MTLDGHTEWTGPDPQVVKLTDNGVRRVQIVLVSGGHHRRDTYLEIRITPNDVDALIESLQSARAWVAQG